MATWGTGAKPGIPGLAFAKTTPERRQKFRAADHITVRGHNKDGAGLLHVDLDGNDPLDGELTLRD